MIRQRISTFRSVVNRLQSSPAAERLITGLTDAYFRMAIAHSSFPHSLSYFTQAPIDPLTVVTVDPNRIQYLVEDSVYPQQTRDRNQFPMPKYQHAGTVVGGSWDDQVHRFEDGTLYESFKAHFESGIPWEETEFFEEVIGHLDDGVCMWGCYTREEFKQRCSIIDELYENIRDNGYFSQAQLGHRSAPPMIDREASSLARRIIYDEITVCIGRSGELLFFDGRNRLAITKLLGLSSIPVWIMVRHPNWQQTREAVASGEISMQELPEQLVNHPDLHGLW